MIPLAILAVAVAWLWLDGRTRALERAALTFLRARREMWRARRDATWTARRCGF